MTVQDLIDELAKIEGNPRIEFWLDRQIPAEDDLIYFSTRGAEPGVVRLCINSNHEDCFC